MDLRKRVSKLTNILVGADLIISALPLTRCNSCNELKGLVRCQVEGATMEKTRRPYIQTPEEQAGDVLRKAKLEGLCRDKEFLRDVKNLPPSPP